jgi:hypothetical protein
LTAVNIFTPPPAGSLAAIGSEAKGDGSSETTGTGFSVGYDALLERYLITVPSMPSGYFFRRSATDVDPSWWVGTLASLDRTNEHGHVNVLKPSNPSFRLTYTTLADYNLSDSPEPFGFFAFGTATQVGAIPVAGSATYDAILRGASTQRYGQIGGTAVLEFDFAVGKLSGHLDPVIHDPTGLGFNDTALGRYDFTNTVYSAGGTTFSGQLSNPTVSSAGSFNGLLTGPAAEELMGRWIAPYQFPGTPSQNGTIFGVLVGKRQ